MATEGSTLIAHNPKFQSVIVSREELGRFKAPTGTSTWKPIPHATLVGTLLGQLSRFGLKPVREQYAVGKEGLALFAALDLEASEDLDLNGRGRSMALGFRHANDKYMALHLVGGTRVFVCDNLALSGEEIAIKKHSRGLQLANMIREGLGKFLDGFRRFNAQIIEAEGHTITDDEAKVRLFDLRYDGVLPVSIYDEASSNYFRAAELQYEDSAPRTTWGLHNACTRAVKALAPASQYRTLRDLGKSFGFGSNN